MTSVTDHYLYLNQKHFYSTDVISISTIVSSHLNIRAVPKSTIKPGQKRIFHNVEALKLYKTGRTNANDGGIDFVMRPLGRFFQVTETLDFKKYFLDIEKIERYPITFVVKTTDAEETILEQLKENAVKTYVIESIVDKYMSCIEEIINIPKLIDCFTHVEENGELSDVLNEILLQSKVEFNYDDEE